MTEPKPTYTNFVNTNEIRDMVGQSPVTHFDDCWKYHPSCLVTRLCDEIDELRQEKNAICMQRDKLCERVNWFGHDNEELENNVMLKHDQIEALKQERTALLLQRDEMLKKIGELK